MRQPRQRLTRLRFNTALGLLAAGLFFESGPDLDRAVSAFASDGAQPACDYERERSSAITAATAQGWIAAGECAVALGDPATATEAFAYAESIGGLSQTERLYVLQSMGYQAEAAGDRDRARWAWTEAAGLSRSASDGLMAARALRLAGEDGAARARLAALDENVFEGSELALYYEERARSIAADQPREAAMIEDRLDVMRLDSGRDYRLERLTAAPVYYTPLGPDADAAMDDAFERLTLGANPQTCTLTIQGRELEVKREAAGVARFTFAELCDRPLGAADYLTLADTFHTLLIDHADGTAAPKGPQLGRLQQKALDTLGLEAGASKGDVRKRYAELVRAYHPDANAGDRSREEALQRVVASYQILKSAGMSAPGPMPPTARAGPATRPTGRHAPARWRTLCPMLCTKPL